MDKETCNQQAFGRNLEEAFSSKTQENFQNLRESMMDKA